MKSLKYVILILLNLVILLKYTNSYAEKLSISGFYIGQSYWEVYENIKKLTKTNEFPQKMNFNIDGFETTFDRDLRLTRIVIPSQKIFNHKPSYEVDRAKITIDTLLKNFNKEYIKFIKGINTTNVDFDPGIYEYSKDGEGFYFGTSLRDKGYTVFIGPIILQKVWPITGPVVKGLQLGKSIFLIEGDPRFTNGLFINRPFFLIHNQLSNYCTIIPNTSQIMMFNWRREGIKKTFGIEKIDNAFIQKFMNSYKIEAAELTYQQFCDQNNIPNDYILDPPGHPDYIARMKFYNCGEYYVIFLLGNKSDLEDGIWIMYKDAAPFPPPKIPLLNNPIFD